MKIDSLCVKPCQIKITTKSHELPLVATSSFIFDKIEEGIKIFKGEENGHVYSRYGNPTIESVAQKIADLEVYGSSLAAFGIMTSSGMSAISTIATTFLKQGFSLLTQQDLYGGTTELFLHSLKGMGINTQLTDLNDLERLENLIVKDKNIKVCYFETPANPTLKCVDIQALVDLCKKYDVLTIADNTFCTPLLQQPLLLGVDFVIHSTTKYLNGHGNAIAGIIIGTKASHYKQIWKTMKLLGTNCNPWDAWLTNIGIKTLPLRMEQHTRNAQRLADFLVTLKKVKKVNYLGLSEHESHLIAKKQMKGYGGMMSVALNLPYDKTLQFINNLKFCTIAPTLGDVDTLILHPASSSHLNVDRETRIRNGITDGLIRVSVGIENIEDIIFDFEQALDLTN